MSEGLLFCVFYFGLLFAPDAGTGEQQQKDAVAALRENGVEVEYAAPLKQVWLEPEKGKPSAGKPLRVWFQGPWKAKAEDFEHLPRMRDLYGVTFGSDEIAENWLRVLEKTPQLKEVILRGSGFTNASTRYLANLKELDSLSLTWTQVTDEGLANLGHLKNLEFLSVNGSEGITDKGFRCLAVKNLRYLNLADTSVTDAGVASLKDATKMEDLALSGRTGKAGLQHLQGLKNLKRLRIGEMVATEAEMQRILNQAKNLEKIETSLGNYTRKGWEESESLREKLDRVERLWKKHKDGR